MPRYLECPVCRRPVASRSRYCERHKARLIPYGDAEAVPLRLPYGRKRSAFDVELKVARRYLQLHAETEAVQSSIQLAEALLSYKADTPITADLRLQEALNFQRDSGAPPSEIVARMVAFNLYADRRPFKNQRAEDAALGRLITHTMPLGDFRWSAAVYIPAGQLARQYLGRFALALIKRVERDAARVQSLVAKSAAL
jgi:hypothetical protein